MHLPRRGVSTYRPWLRNSIIVIIFLCTVACTSAVQSPHLSPLTATVLPGQQIWKQHASSFLFGTNDTYEWSNSNIETSPAIQQALSDAGFTLIRSFFPDNASDATIEKRMQTIENSHAHCLGVITNIANLNFNQHLVRYLGNRCQMYEFGNESDYNGITIEHYLSAWNKSIPVLRNINPHAVFIGPATYNADGKNGFMNAFLQGVKASKVLPDAVSFHWYPCYHDTKQSCLAKASSYAQAAQDVRGMVQRMLGKDLPVGISEWNFDPGNPPPSYGDDANFIKQFSTQAIQAMIQAGVAFACQFDAASYSGYGHLDMFNVSNAQPKPQYDVLKDLIQQYRSSAVAGSSPAAVPSTTAQPSGWQPAMDNTGPLLSRGKTTYCSNNNVGAGGNGAIVNGHYGQWSFWRTSLSALPGWCAIHLDTPASRLLLTWESDYVFDYTGDAGMGPQDYTIATSVNSSNGADGTWQTVVTVVDNHTRVREHLLPFTGQTWVKMSVTKGQTHAYQPYVTIDQIDLYDVSTNLNDTFFFSGDSITGLAYGRYNDSQPSYAEDVHAAFPQRFPAMLDGGLGGWNSDGAVQDIDSWLALNPDIHYWLLGWGTNDALEMVSTEHFRTNLQTVVDKIKQAGHIPVLAHIPYENLAGARGVSVNQEIQALNGVIDEITAANQLFKGPDLYQLFRSNPTAYLLSSDGIHPTPAGAIAMNKAWFEALRPFIYNQ